MPEKSMSNMSTSLTASKMLMIKKIEIQWSEILPDLATFGQKNPAFQMIAENSRSGEINPAVATLRPFMTSVARDKKIIKPENPKKPKNKPEKTSQEKHEKREEFR